jgi:DNA-binding CsgD family transcriptional regulator
VSDVLLSETEQAALRFVLAAEPVAGQPLPRPDVLERLAALLPCDTIGAAVTDQAGYVVDHIELRAGHGGAVDGTVGQERSDSLSVGFSNGKDRAVEVWWDRRTGEFSPRDVAVLTMISPAVQRLVRDAASPSLPASLTVQERRTLMLVAAGFSNREVARRMGVATCTVRKHLEHAYRKLGVTNRLAAAVAFRGQELTADPRDRLAAHD